MHRSLGSDLAFLLGCLHDLSQAAFYQTKNDYRITRMQDIEVQCCSKVRKIMSSESLGVGGITKYTKGKYFNFCL